MRHTDYFYGTILLQDTHVERRLAQAEAAIQHLFAEQNIIATTVPTQSDHTETPSSLRAHQELPRDRDALSWHLAEIFYITPKRWAQHSVQEYFAFMSDLDTFATRSIPDVGISTLHNAARDAVVTWGGESWSKTLLIRSYDHPPIEEASDSDDTLECPVRMTRCRASRSGNRDTLIDQSVSFRRENVAVRRRLSSSTKGDMSTTFSITGPDQEPSQDTRQSTSFSNTDVQLAEIETRKAIFIVARATSSAPRFKIPTADGRAGGDEMIEEIDEEEEDAYIIQL